MADINTYYLFLRRLRLEQGITQNQLAQSMKVPQSYISKYESGEQRLDLPELECICNALGISLLDFIRMLCES